MSLFEDDRYRWRETYFVQFPAKNRPPLEKVRQALSTLGETLQLADATADSSGRIESVTILAPDDFAAIDVSFLGGQEVLEQAQDLAKDITAAGCDETTNERIKLLRRYDGRFDVLHFERIPDTEEQDEPEGMLNPSTLLLVLDCLAQLTEGIAIDPQAGTFIQ
ncbi:MAG TPA: hypothetical protein VJL29_08575 [Thermoguttaceae bacterium]|nr:hypothetical protein [Thermoguttaceae bacterium]